jgi:hypothetical protein
MAAGLRSHRILCKSDLPPNLEFPTSIPPLIFVEVCHSLLTDHFYVTPESNRKDGLVVRSRGPIKVIDGLGCAVIAESSEVSQGMTCSDKTHSKTLLNSSPLANSLSFESQIVNSSPSSRGTTSHACQFRQDEYSTPVTTKDRFLCRAARRSSQTLSASPDGSRTFPKGLIWL